MQGEVELSAAKSQLGHTEAGAGALGALHAVLRSRRQMQQPFTHLRNLNPHLAPLLDSGKAPRLLLPRQAGPGISKDASEAFTSGISSFAFQVCSYEAFKHYTTSSFLKVQAQAKLLVHPSNKVW